MATTFPVEWGHRPEYMPLVIVRSQDFYQQMMIDPEDALPVGTTARIDVVRSNRSRELVATWDGICSEELIEFAVESELIDELPRTGLDYYLYVVFPDTPDLDFCVTYGVVEHL